MRSVIYPNINIIYYITVIAFLLLPMTTLQKIIYEKDIGFRVSLKNFLMIIIKKITFFYFLGSYEINKYVIYYYVSRLVKLFDDLLSASRNSMYHITLSNIHQRLFNNNLSFYYHVYYSLNINCFCYWNFLPIL